MLRLKNDETKLDNMNEIQPLEATGPSEIPWSLLHFDSEIFLFGFQESRVLENLARRGGLERIFNCFERNAKSFSEPDFKKFASLAQEGHFFSIMTAAIADPVVRRGFAGRFFEEIAAATLDLRLQAGQFVLNGEDTVTLTKIIEADQRFWTMPDGLVFTGRHNLWQMVGVAEYKLRPNLERFYRQWVQYKNLQAMVNRLLVQPPEGKVKGQVKKMLKDGGQSVGKVSFNAGNLTIYYVVPVDFADEIGFPQDDRLKVIESPFTRREVLRMLGALYFDYLKFKVRESTEDHQALVALRVER